MAGGVGEFAIWADPFSCMLSAVVIPRQCNGMLMAFI